MTLQGTDRHSKLTAGIKIIRMGCWRAAVFNLICYPLIIQLLLDLSTFVTSKIRYSLNEIVLNMNGGFFCFCCYYSVTKSCLTLC